MSEENRQVAWDGRKEFIEMLSAFQQKIFFSHMRGDWDSLYEVGLHMYITVARLLTEGERELIEKSFKNLCNALRTDNVDVRGRALTTLRNLYDALHAHSLLLPHYEDVEEDALDVNKILTGGGL